MTILSTKVETRIARDFPSFLKKHWRIFSADPISLVDSGDAYELMIVRKRSGLPFHSGGLETREWNTPDGHRFKFFSPRPFGNEPFPSRSDRKISREKAEKTAMESVALRKHPRHSVLSSELVIRVDHKLAWWIRIRESGNSKYVSCYVDAISGKVIDCRSSSDLQQR